VCDVRRGQDPGLSEVRVRVSSGNEAAPDVILARSP
jgi:hypothetical protein